MSSALKNFTITFAIALIVFLLLGFWAAPLLEDAFDFSEMGSSQAEDSTDVPDESSQTGSDVSKPEEKPDIDENGDVFTAVVMSVDDNDCPVSIVFIDANGKSKQYIYCTINPEMKVSNEIGNMVPVRALFRGMAPAEITRCITAITGIETDYCLKFNKNSISTVASGIPRANVVLPNNLSYTIPNPKYQGQILDPLLPIPEDYTVTVANGEDGTVRLNDVQYEKTNLEWLLQYNPNADGSEYTALYELISSALIKQFLQSGSSSLASLLSVCESNLSVNQADSHLEAILSYNKWNLTQLPYPMKNDRTANWETAVKTLRELDGTYN